MSRAIILCSGGLDSTCAVFYAKRYPFESPIVFSVRYGQPAAEHELMAAGRAADCAGYEHLCVQLTDAFPRMGLLGGVVNDAPGPIAAQFVPARNIVLATVALSHALGIGPGPWSLILGCCAEDQSGFPDCRPQFRSALEQALRLGTDSGVDVLMPWATVAKGVMLGSGYDAAERDVIERSWSCYCANGPCGTCGACMKRTAAFRCVPDWNDRPERARSFGGDVMRAHLLGSK